jgi:hypothetical protein
MRIAYWEIKATNTPSEYVTLIVCPLQKRYVICTFSVLLITYQAVTIPVNGTVTQHAIHAIGYRPVLHVVK